MSICLNCREEFGDDDLYFDVKQMVPDERHRLLRREITLGRVHLKCPPPPKVLVPLLEWNAKKIEESYARSKSWPKPNGIACPECGAELQDNSDACVSQGYPPITKTRVGCPDCDFQSQRIV